MLVEHEIWLLESFLCGSLSRTSLKITERAPVWTKPLSFTESSNSSTPKLFVWHNKAVLPSFFSGTGSVLIRYFSNTVDRATLTSFGRLQSHIINNIVPGTSTLYRYPKVSSRQNSQKVDTSTLHRHPNVYLPDKTARPPWSYLARLLNYFRAKRDFFFWTNFSVNGTRKISQLQAVNVA